MLSQDTKIPELNQHLKKKSDKVPFIIYVDLKCLIGKIDGCKRNPENSSTTIVCGHIPIRFINVYNIFI